GGASSQDRQDRDRHPPPRPPGRRPYPGTGGEARARGCRSPFRSTMDCRAEAGHRACCGGRAERGDGGGGERGCRVAGRGSSRRGGDGKSGVEGKGGGGGSVGG